MQGKWKETLRILDVQSAQRARWLGVRRKLRRQETEDIRREMEEKIRCSRLEREKFNLR